MRSWDKYCEDTEKALVHFIDCIAHFRSYEVSYLFNKSKSIDNA